MVVDLLRGALAGALIGLPIGPTGALCASLALQGRPRSAFAGSLGTAAALAVWATLAALGAGLTGVEHAPWLRAACGLLLVAVAARGWRGRRRPADVPAAGAFAACFGIVISNPAGGALFAAAFVGPLRLDGAALAAGVGAAIGTVAVFAPMIAACAALRLDDAVRQRVVGALALAIGAVGVSLVVSAAC
jgi:threonine/homoserine/homoserine lactone efflux protein